MNKKEQTRLRVERYRERKSVTESPDSVTVSPDNVTQDVTHYPAILLALTDPIKRRKLEKISQSLKNHNVDKIVYYGYPDKGVPFDMVGEMLEVTQCKKR